MTTYPLQDHIHLAATLGGAPENAPVYEWATSDRVMDTVGFMSINRALSGAIKPHVKKVSGVPLILQPFKYILVLKEESPYTLQDRIDQLQAMAFKTVYLVDHYHPADGQDHTPTVRTMFLARIGSLKVFNPTLIKYYVDIELEDARSIS